MTAKVIDGKAFAARVRAQVAAHVARLKEEHGLTPGLAVVLVGEDPASQVYVRNKACLTIEVGMASFEHRLAAETVGGRSAGADRPAERGSDSAWHSGAVAAAGASEFRTGDQRIDPAKDVDGFHISNVGLLGTGQKAMVPCTPLGCLMMLRDHHGKLAGLNAVVVGRSQHRRQADGATAAGRQLHGDDRAFAGPRTWPRSAGGRIFWWRRSGGPR